MFEKHFGLRENPFPAGHQLRFLYPSREHQEARAHLRYGIENREPFVLITGEVGTGKTTALYDALAEWGNQVSVALITNSALTRPELLEEICLRFGVPLPADASKPKMLTLLERHLLGIRSRGEHAVLLLDEAQNLPTELLEEIRLLSNVESGGEKLMQIFLVGQPELESKLGRPELRQLRQRITVHYRLNPLSPEETAGYIHHRLSVAGGNAWSTFPPESCREVYRFTHGIPREINTVASNAMITAYSENAPTVTIEHVRSAANEGEFHSVLGENDLRLPSAADLAAALRQGEAEAAAAQEPETGSEPQPATPAPPSPAPETPVPPRGASPSPHAGAPPAWTPPPEKPAERVEPVLKEELDAWSAAASDLLKARQRAREGGVEPPSPAPAPPAPTPAPAPPLRARSLESPAAAPRPSRDPAPAETSAGGDSASSRLSALPPRLRDKIEQDFASEEHARSAALPWLIAVAAVAVVVVGFVLAQRFGVIDVPFMRGIAGTPAIADTTGAQGATANEASQGPVAAQTDSAAAAAADTAATPAPAAGATPAPSPSGSPTAEATPPEPPKPALNNVYGIAVGDYLEQDRAGQESARLADLTGLPGRVVRHFDGGTSMFRVVLGNFDDEPSAEHAADRLLLQPGVREARVIVIAKVRAND